MAATKAAAAKKAAPAKASGPRKTTSKVGNLTREWELRFSPSGTPWATNGLAVYTPKEPGNWKGDMEVTFYELVCFQTLAENVIESTGKGTRVVVTGNAEVDTWQDDEGNDRVTKKILCDGLGPDLRFASATVTKVTSKSAAVTVEGSGDDADF